MKITRVVPIKKPDESTDMSNYRPISILLAITIHAIINHVQNMYDTIDAGNIVFSLFFKFSKSI